MNTENNLPVTIKNNLPLERKRNNLRIKNQLQRVGKILANIGISIAGLGTMTLGGPVAPIIGGAIYLLTGTNALKNVIFKKEKGLMFVTYKNLKGEICISEDSTDFKSFSKMKGFQPGEKGVLMGIQMLIGLQRYKQSFHDQDQKTELAKSGVERVYPQVFTTETHGINIKTIEALEKLGYIQIERNEPKKKSILFFERIEFKQYKEARKALSAKIKGNQEELKEYQKQINEIAFRITDKQMDFEDIYKQYQEVKNTRESNPFRKPLKRIGILFDGLRNRNIDIQRNALGEYEIDYNSSEPFARRMERERNIKEKTQRFRGEQKVEAEQTNALKSQKQPTLVKEYEDERE